LKQLTETQLISRQAAKGKDKTKEIAATDVAKARSVKKKRKERKKGMTEMTEAWISFGGTMKGEFGTTYF
jgi:hypothetical protein